MSYLIDPMLRGVLQVIGREHETSRPDIEATAIALGLAVRREGKIWLTDEGKRASK